MATHVQILLAHLPPLLFVIARLGGLMVFAPIFGSSVIPVRIKVFIPLVVGVAIYPVLAGTAIATLPGELELWSLVPWIGLEVLVGVCIGYLGSLPMVAVQTGGLVMGQQMGLGFASFYNPGIDDQADLVGQILFFMALAGFLAIGGHDALVLAVLRTFEHVPLGGFVFDGTFLDVAIGLLLAAFELALRVAAPVLAVVGLQSVAMGFMTKTVPSKLNILSLGFPLRILIGLAVIMLGLYVIDEVMMDSLDEALALIFEWVDAA